MSRLKVFILAFVAALLIPYLALASQLEDEVEFKFGLGSGHTAVDSQAESKIASLAVSHQLTRDALRYKLGTALWNDSRSDLGRKSGGIVFGQLGVDVQPGDLYIAYYIGPGLKLPNDSLLGGPVQFIQSAEIGLRDRTDCSVGLGYVHISSAGIQTPNVGRDYFFVKIGFPL